MGVEASESAEPPLGDPLPLQVGEDDLPRVADAHPFHLALAIDEDAHLSSDVPRDFGELARELVGDERAGWKPPLVELFEPVPFARL
jgi:hypothetical protein